MALQMTGCVPILVPSTSDLLPDVNELEKIAFVDPPDGRPARAVTIVNPGQTCAYCNFKGAPSQVTQQAL